MAPSFTDGVLERISKARELEPDPHLRDDLNISWLTVLWAASGIPERIIFPGPPHVAATYQVLHCHPDGDVFQFRDELRRAWDGDADAVVEMLDNVKARLRVRPSGMDVIVEDLRTLIQVMFARDFWDHKAKTCENPDCLTPYFQAVRAGQKFCSHKCAVLINVRRFREAH